MLQIEPSQFLPANHGQNCVQRVQIRDLDVLVVLVRPIALSERHASSGDALILRLTRGDAENAAESLVLRVQPHARVDEYDAEFFQLFDDELLSGARVDAQEDGWHSAEQLDVARVDVRTVRDNALVRPGVDALEIDVRMTRFVQRDTSPSTRLCYFPSLQPRAVIDNGFAINTLVKRISKAARNVIDVVEYETAAKLLLDPENELLFVNIYDAISDTVQWTM